MAKFIELSRLQRTLAKKNARTFGVVCENQEQCGAPIKTFWEPRASINIADSKALAAEFDRMKEKFLHHCPSCTTAVIAQQPPGQNSGIVPAYYEKIEKANQKLWQQKRHRRVA